MKLKTENILILKEDQLFEVELPGSNPYLENSTSWHCFIDVSCSTGVQTNKESVLSLKVMMREHSQTVEYYQENLNELIKDGLLKLLKGGEK